jgi:hypothetical protein
LQASESNVGQQARCPLCDRITIVPATDEPDVPPRGVNQYGEIERDDPRGSPPERQPPPRRSYERDEPPPRRPYERDEPYRRPYDREPYRRPYDEDYPPYQTPCQDANTALWMGVAGLFCCQIFSIFALIYGIKALSQINGSNGRLSGQGQAIAGIVMAALGLLGVLFYFVIIASGGM